MYLYQCNGKYFKYSENKDNMYEYLKQLPMYKDKKFKEKIELLKYFEEDLFIRDYFLFNVEDIKYEIKIISISKL